MAAVAVRPDTSFQTMTSRNATGGSHDYQDSSPAPTAEAAVDLLEACEQSQHEICRELHDEGLQFVTAVSVCLDRAVAAFAAGDIDAGARALARAREINGRIGSFLGEVASRSESFSFGSATVAGALRVRAGRLAAAGVSTEVRGSNERHPAAVEILILRLAKPVLDHLAAAGATRILVSVSSDAELVRVIFDSDARAIDTADLAVPILRARLAGGTLAVGESRGGGRTAMLRLPLPASG